MGYHGWTGCWGGLSPAWCPPGPTSAPHGAPASHCVQQGTLGGPGHFHSPDQGSSAAPSPRHPAQPGPVPGGLGSTSLGAGSLAGNPRSAETRCAMQPSPLPRTPLPASPLGQPGAELGAISLPAARRGEPCTSSPGVAEEPGYLFRGSAPLPRPWPCTASRAAGTPSAWHMKEILTRFPDYPMPSFV
ncbi:integrin alpha-M-like [Platysternon megacephalum]|uniref:Integrin alpha-M-like n=1 Tax=Platysternon megacephalum TaxID=55544 RepID=A0A4D9DI44_9SAUR|nr:integrin alpha-M-like [Platysternon megacephalum]